MTEVALITGCATGIGRALALALSERMTAGNQRQFKVYATDYRLDCVKDLQQDGIEIGELDVTSQESVNKCVGSILETEGRIDLLICNAGVSSAGYLAEMDYGNVEKLFDVNVHGVFRTIQAVVKNMMERQHGKIAFMGSVLAHYTQIHNGPYSGAKAAINLMAESLRMELDPFGITVTTVVPGWVKSDIMGHAQYDYARYERPGSFYEKSVPYVRQRREKGATQGSTTAQAAKDIATGLAQPKPSRFLYTGTTLWTALFWGFIQQWFRPWWLADSLQKSMHLQECARDGPRVWSGLYKGPMKPAPS